MHRRAVQRHHRYRERGAQYGPDESLEITAAEIVALLDEFTGGREPYLISSQVRLEY
jgi:hypothetical protein